VRQGENLPVCCFANLCDDVKSANYKQVRATRVARWQQQSNEKSENSVKLYGQVESQVADTLLFR